jgi:hypothetical protein
MLLICRSGRHWRPRCRLSTRLRAACQELFTPHSRAASIRGGPGHLSEGRLYPRRRGTGLRHPSLVGGCVRPYEKRLRFAGVRLSGNAGCCRPRAGWIGLLDAGFRRVSEGSRARPHGLRSQSGGAEAQRRPRRGGCSQRGVGTSASAGDRRARAIKGRVARLNLPMPTLL